MDISWFSKSTLKVIKYIWVLGNCDIHFSPCSQTKWLIEKSSGPVIHDKDKTTPDMCCYHVEHKGPCGWNVDKWKTILGVYLSKRAHSIFPFYLLHQTKFICCLTVLSQWHRGKKTIFPLEHPRRHGDRGKTHLRFVWYNLFLERVYSQAFRALSFLFYLYSRQAVHIYLSRKACKYVAYWFEYCMLRSISCWVLTAYMLCDMKALMWKW